MPLLRTTEKIFIGYSLPQLPHKETAERVIASINATNRHKAIQLYVCEYRQMVVDTIPLQNGIDRVIEDCDLVILLFGARVGAGLEWEARHSLDLFRKGHIYKILPYIFADPRASDSGSDRGPISPWWKSVAGESEQFFVRSRRKLAGILVVFRDFATKSWRKRAARSATRLLPRAAMPTTDIQRFYADNDFLYYTIESPESFEERLRQHIEVWLAEEERIVERQRDFLRRGLLRHFAIEDVAFGDDILAIHRRDRGNLGATPETEAAFREYVSLDENQEMVREDAMDYYLIARHLRDAVLKSRPEVFSQAEFINPIHQFLAALIRQDDDSVRDAVIAQYREWLRSRRSSSERTRSFAAFQLGMLQARDSADLLLDAVQNRGELKNVRHYAIYALGMLRQRSMIVPLMDLHASEEDGVLRDAMVNSILFMMGVTE